MSEFEGFDNDGGDDVDPRPGPGVPAPPKQHKGPRVPGTPAPPKRESASERLLRSQPYRLVPDANLTPAMEQEIRDHFGYSASEKRTRAERQGTADKMVAKSRASLEAMGTSQEEIEALWRRQAELMEHERKSDLKHPAKEKS